MYLLLKVGKVGNTVDDVSIIVCTLFLVLVKKHFRKVNAYTSDKNLIEFFKNLSKLMLIFSYGNEKMGESVKGEKSYRQPASKKVHFWLK